MMTLTRMFAAFLGTLALVATAQAQLADGPLPVDALVTGMPGDAANGQRKVHYQAKHQPTLPSGAPQAFFVALLPDTQELRIETVTVIIDLPAGQVPTAHVSTYNPDGTITPFYLALQPQGMYFVNGSGRARFVGTHAVRLLSRAGTQIPQATKYDWFCGRVGGTNGVMNCTLSVSGYQTPASSAIDG